VCQVPYVHLETKLGEVIVYGLGSCLYVCCGLKDESTIINIEENIKVEGGCTHLSVLKYCEVVIERSMWYHGRYDGKFQFGAKLGVLRSLLHVLAHCW